MGISLLAFLAGMVAVILIGLFMLPALRRLKIGQTIRTDGPSTHLAKAGTPTMGGLMFVVAMLPIAIIFSRLGMAMWLFLFLYVACGAIGFVDDMLKVVWHRSLGLTARQKLVGQFAAVLLFLIACNYFLNRGTDIFIPGININLELGIFYYILLSVFLVGMINGVNLNDGLDGLAAGVSFFVFGGYWLMALAFIANPPLNAVDYQEIANLAAAMAGCCIGFLFYNRYPAKVFMGDTGSLAIGGAVAAFAVICKAEFVLLLLGGVYLIEAISVMLQVFSFKVFGKRIFRMSPLHHHYELVMGERKTVRLFWLLALITVALSLAWMLL